MKQAVHFTNISKWNLLINNIRIKQWDLNCPQHQSTYRREVHVCVQSGFPSKWTCDKNNPDSPKAGQRAKCVFPPDQLRPNKRKGKHLIVSWDARGINAAALFSCLQRKHTTHPGPRKHHIRGENYFFWGDQMHEAAFMPCHQLQGGAAPVHILASTPAKLFTLSSYKSSRNKQTAKIID